MELLGYSLATVGYTWVLTSLYQRPLSRKLRMDAVTCARAESSSATHLMSYFQLYLVFMGGGCCCSLLFFVCFWKPNKSLEAINVEDDHAVRKAGRKPQDSLSQRDTEGHNSVKPGLVECTS